MPFYLNLPALFAEQSTIFKLLYFFGIVAAVFVLPYVAGQMLANMVRMRDYGWKIGLILMSLAIATLILARSWEPGETVAADASPADLAAATAGSDEDGSTQTQDAKAPKRAKALRKGRFNIPLGVDLKGGVILVYEVDLEESDGAPNMDDLVQALTNRINPSGTKEIVIRPYGDRQVEIIVPEVDPIEVAHIKRLIETAGSLEFRIVANSEDHKEIIALADVMASSKDPASRLSKDVMRPRSGDEKEDKRMGQWVRAAQKKLKAGELAGNILRNATTGQRLYLRFLKPIDGDEGLEEYLVRNDLTGIDILVATDDGVNVTGEHLGIVSGSVDEYLQPCVNFRMKGQGVQKFRFLTSQNLPNMDTTPPFYRHLGIILDEQLLSFPRLITTISNSGRITGNFTQEEVDFLVGILRAGRLPATLKKEPISENLIGSMLGNDTINKGKRAIAISLAAVLVFVALYYRFAGIVACAALLMNLVIVLAMMVLLNAPLTLPGLAGLVLTIGMSVDANVLIFERIREEMQRGAALRMAIRNGFGRATTTIVDANVTTLITALVLYAIGTDQIRGFAVTLILGILVSMFTAIFCSRVIFDIAERRRWITELRMRRIVGATSLDFMGKRRIAIAISVSLIVIGMIAVGVRGKSIFDIDFNGGTSVTMVLKESMSPDDVRGRIGDRFSELDRQVQFSVNTVSVDERPEDSVYKIDADLNDVGTLEEYVMDAFKDKRGKSLLLSYSMDFSGLEEVIREPEVSQSPELKAEPVTEPAKANEQAAPAADGPDPAPASADEAQAPAAEKATETAKENDQDKQPSSSDSSALRNDLPGDNVLAMADPRVQEDPPSEPSEPATADDKPADSTVAETAPAETAPAETAEAETTEAETTEAETTEAETTEAETTEADSETEANVAVSEVRTVAFLEFGDEINAPTLLEALREAGKAIEQPVSDLIVDTDKVFDWDQESGATADAWYVSMVGNQDNAQEVLQEMKQHLASTPVWPSSSKIGGKVAGDTRQLAIAALLTSLLGIVGYIWIRFQRVVFGLAAVIALLHDVAMTLGAIAVSVWLAKPFGFLLIEDFRISLPIVAAFLTIIGYSLNDTIVVFDRIREVRGKSLRLTSDMINLSINQTLSRTLLTSFTTLIVVLILYAIGGQGIHGFAFALVIGVMVGTYSSIFIASPALLWLFGRNQANAAGKKK